MSTTETTTGETTTERTTGWQLDEDGAAAYERFLVPALMDPWADDLVDAVGIGAEARVLDVACGTGIVSRHVARRVGERGAITGVDINAAMLSVADQVTAEVAPPIRWEQADAHDLPLEDGSFDVVLCQQGLQFLADPETALREMYRVAASAARLGVNTCAAIERQPVYRILAEVVTRHLGVDAGEIIAAPYALGDADDLRGLISAVGFADVHLRRVFTTFRTPSAEALLRGETTSSPLGDIVAELDGDAVTALIDDLEDALRPHTDDDGIVYPFETLVATAVR